MKTKIKRLIEEGRDFLVTTHIDPDGDAIGSTYAFAFALESLGKKATVYLNHEVPYRYEFLPGPRVMHTMPQGNFDAVFVLDCGSLFRIGEGHENVTTATALVNIDHHDTNDLFGTINLVDNKASSTGEIIYRLLKYLKVDIDKNIAVNIYTAVFTDTGSLRYENTSLSAYRVCEEMVKAGANPSRIAMMVYENHPKERYLLLGEVLCTLATYNGTVAMAHVTSDMFERTGTNSEFVDGFVEFIKEIRGIEVAVLMRELNKNLYKVSMRGKGTVDVAEICNMFGGGGHRNAAGCRIEGTMEEARHKLLEALSVRQ
ncbi:MAG: bifunctional oligoribonuclease/PAP phosphatase NrnA [Syntrophorhabdaceae bacterium]|mgnify:CR=1 FL=1|nr:bifunctional oligoribonuclease/PAP phosphatase NrnA [Syntrophorhabdaceae bacterium]MDD4196363.1 bifunctional oligoribonuclease/PAP phosphatase NrnA [Syntrophorhabdaceae bacterium]